AMRWFAASSTSSLGRHGLSQSVDHRSRSLSNFATPVPPPRHSVNGLFLLAIDRGTDRAMWRRAACKEFGYDSGVSKVMKDPAPSVRRPGEGAGGVRRLHALAGG